MADGSGKGSRQVIPYSSSRKTTLPRTSYRVGTLSAKPVVQSLAYERTTKVRHEDKQTGSYERYSVKEKASTGEPHVEKGTGQVGVKDEFTQRSTIKIGDKSGYILYERDERFRDVKFGNSPNNRDIDFDNDNGKYDDGDENHTGYDNHHDAVHSVFSYDYDVAPSYDYDDGSSDDDDY